MTRRFASLARFLLLLMVVVASSRTATISGAAGAAEAASETPPVDLSIFEGQWRQVEDPDATDARLSAIGLALEDLSWIMKRFASPILRKTTAPPSEMEFVWDGARLHQGVHSDDGAFFRPINLNGERYFGTDDRGVAFSSTWAWTPSGLRVHWEQDQATGSTLYRVDSVDAPLETMVVEHTINVTAISNVQPIVFLSRFVRDDSHDPLMEFDSTADATKNADPDAGSIRATRTEITETE